MSEQPVPISEANWFYRVSRFICWVFFKVLGLRSINPQNVPDTGRFIIASNHQSYFDPVIVGSFIKRPLQFMARDTLFRNRYFSRLIRSYNAFPVKRGETDVTAIKQSLRLLKEGKALLLFPEGTRTPNGTVQAMQAGAIALARRSKAPIIPVAVDGIFEAWPRDAKFPRWARMYVQYGLPIPPETFADMTDQQSADYLTRAIRDLHNELRKRAGRAPFEYAAAEIDAGPMATANDPAMQGADRG